MKTQFNSGHAERAGTWLGRAWRAIVRAEKNLAGWLRAHGLSAATVTALLWVLNLTLLAAALYSGLVLILLIIGALLVVVAAPHVDLTMDKEEPRWKHGAAGYGLYKNETRIDGYDPDGQG